MLENEWLDFLAHGFSGLPRSNDEFFAGLWQPGRIKFNGKSNIHDKVDELSARLVCATLHKREKLLIILPDRTLHRPAFLFATGLIMHGLDQYKRSRLGGQVLYFGSTIGIRNQLSNVRVGNLSLDSVFPQIDIQSQDPSKTRLITSQHDPSLYLPLVISAYAPVDPVAVLKHHHADWIAIDCGDEPTLRWLSPLLEYACARNLPVVAWCQNALSDSVSEFARAGIKIFHWPYLSKVSATPSHSASQSLLVRNSEFKMTTLVKPLVLDGQAVQGVTTPLRNAYSLLARASGNHNGRLSQDAIRLGWTYLRLVESLSVPLDFYETEASHYWGLKKIESCRQGFEAFIKTLRTMHSSLSSVLEEAATHLDVAVKHIRNSEPPLWSVLTDLCVLDVPEDTARIFVFPSAAKMDVFALALLAKYNITQDELKKLNVWLTSLKDLYRELICPEESQRDYEYRRWVIPEINLVWDIIFTGLPSPKMSTWFEPILRREGYINFVIYSYQYPALARQVEKWSTLLRANLANNINVLVGLGGKVPSSLIELPASIEIAEPQLITARPVSTSKSLTDDTMFWKPIDPIVGIDQLISGGEEEDEFPIVRLNQGSANEKDINEEPVWVEQAIEVYFEEGWYGLFAPDAIINIISYRGDGEQVEEIYIRALRPGNLVAFIPGQRRQSLYDLIISRIHRHPSIELHLALVRRWQEDLRKAYWNWQGNLEELLRQMQRRGSHIVSSLTLKNWLNGQILCPQDREDLRRLADILELEFVQNYYLRIYRAASFLRGLHIDIGKGLSQFILKLATGKRTNDQGQIISEELGLSLRDFRDSLLILRVRSVEMKTGPFFRADLGTLERRSERE